MNEKKERILHAAINLFATEGIAVPTARIAKEAGVSNGTLFNNFATKQALIDEVYLHIKYKIAEQALSADISKCSAKDTFFTLWKSFMRWAIANPVENSVGFLLRSSSVLSAEVVEEAENIFKPATDKLAEAMTRKEIVQAPIDFLCELAGAHIMASIAYATANHLQGEALLEHIDFSFSIYWTGIAR